ncbi:MAG: dihydropteroate synthase [Victivallales bacterium]|nr:dihydropteroate synthase [Victivallales bacterium]
MGRSGSFTFRGRKLDFTGTPLIMGILNVTPDSFYDGGTSASTVQAVEKALAMEAEGADVIDIGGESTRPGFTPITPEEEAARIIPVIRELSTRSTIPISVDTTKSAVARAALEAGAHIVNDVSALADSRMASVIAEFRCGCILMHHAMEAAPAGGTAESVLTWLRQKRDCAMQETGLGPEYFLCDPGIGFGKTQEQNLEIIRDIRVFTALEGSGILLAASRKSFIPAALKQELHPSRRLPGTLITAVHAAPFVEMLRVHDVGDTIQALATARLLQPRA